MGGTAFPECKIQEPFATRGKGHRYERSKDATRGSWPYYKEQEAIGNKN